MSEYNMSQTKKTNKIIRKPAKKRRNFFYNDLHLRKICPSKLKPDIKVKKNKPAFCLLRIDKVEKTPVNMDKILIL